MKLNATAEMESITWPAFNAIHPFAPTSDAPGLLKIIKDLEDWLVAVTGYDNVSLQPTPAARGSTRACSRSATTTSVAATITATPA